MKPGFIQRFDGLPVPWVASWSDEEQFSVAACPYAAGRLALWQPHRPGQGRPIFALPHVVRQRQAIAEQRCSLCGARLQGSTKVSLSTDRPTDVAGHGMIPLVIEPLLHRACAITSLQHCPALGRRSADNLLQVRQVFRAGPVQQLLTRDAVAERIGRPLDGIVGHLKLAITASIDRDQAWLENSRA